MALSEEKEAYLSRPLCYRPFEPMAPPEDDDRRKRWERLLDITAIGHDAYLSGDGRWTSLNLVLGLLIEEVRTGNGHDPVRKCVCVCVCDAEIFDADCPLFFGPVGLRVRLLREVRAQDGGRPPRAQDPVLHQHRMDGRTAAARRHTQGAGVPNGRTRTLCGAAPFWRSGHCK